MWPAPTLALFACLVFESLARLVARHDPDVVTYTREAEIHAWRAAAQVKPTGH